MNVFNYYKENAYKYLGKGIKKPRFREGAMVYTVFYAVCYIKDIKLSVLADTIGVNSSMPRRWIRGEYRPSSENMKKIVDVLNVPEHILFSKPQNPLITMATEHDRKGYHLRFYKAIYYPILLGLIYIHDYPVYSFAKKHDIPYRHFSNFLRRGAKEIDYMEKLEDIFGLHRDILLYKF